MAGSISPMCASQARMFDSASGDCSGRGSGYFATAATHQLDAVATVAVAAPVSPPLLIHAARVIALAPFQQRRVDMDILALAGLDQERSIDFLQFGQGVTQCGASFKIQTNSPLRSPKTLDSLIESPAGITVLISLQEPAGTAVIELDTYNKEMRFALNGNEEYGGST